MDSFFANPNNSTIFDCNHCTPLRPATYPHHCPLLPIDHHLNRRAKENDENKRKQRNRRNRRRRHRRTHQHVDTSEFEAVVAAHCHYFDTPDAIAAQKSAPSPEHWEYPATWDNFESNWSAPAPETPVRNWDHLYDTHYVSAWRDSVNRTNPATYVSSQYDQDLDKFKDLITKHYTNITYFAPSWSLVNNIRDEHDFQVYCARSTDPELIRTLFNDTDTQWAKYVYFQDLQRLQITPSPRRLHREEQTDFVLTQLIQNIYWRQQDTNRAYREAKRAGEIITNRILANPYTYGICLLCEQPLYHTSDIGSTPNVPLLSPPYSHPIAPLSPAYSPNDPFLYTTDPFDPFLYTTENYEETIDPCQLLGLEDLDPARIDDDPTNPYLFLPESKPALESTLRQIIAYNTLPSKYFPVSPPAGTWPRTDPTPEEQQEIDNEVTEYFVRAELEKEVVSFLADSLTNSIPQSPPRTPSPSYIELPEVSSPSEFEYISSDPSEYFPSGYSDCDTD